MSRYLRPFALLPLAALSCIVDARPYPLGTGMAASADSAQTASSNPAGISRFAERAMSAEILFFNSESEWESEFSGIGNRFDTKDSGETVVAGQRVAAGTMLARLDPRDFETRVMLEQAQLNLARADFERFSRLIRSRASPVSEAEVDRRRSLFEMAEVRTAQARKNLQDTTLRAPFDGVVAVTLVDNHTQIQARQPIVTIESSDVLEVIIDLPERVVSRVRSAPRDRPIGEVQFAVLPERRFPVTLGEIATRADPATQTFRVTLALDRPRDVNILPGMTATVYARPDIVADESLRIPVAAVLRSESGQAAVWVVDPDSSRIEQRVVRLREEDGSGTAMVLDGLQAGERIVGAGASQLRAGVEIRPYRAGMLSE